MTESIERLKAALADRYMIERELGSGGMAFVYLAEDLKHGRKVALKLLRPELPQVVGGKRFLEEIRVTAKLHHPNILPLFDSGEIDGMLYYVMPYVDGETLGNRIERERQLPVDEAVSLAIEVAKALEYAHRNGVIHRDVKPGNILFQAGQPLVGDFGIALGISDEPQERITGHGLLVGTPEYMSPEQAFADVPVDARSDVYSLGCVLYEMLVGEPPFVGRHPRAVLGKVINDVPVPARVRRSTVPQYVSDAIQKALEKSPADRFANALDFAEALKGGWATDPPDEDGRPRPRRNRTLLGVVGATLVVTVASILAIAGSFVNDVPALAVGSTRRLTNDQGLELDPAISPNGDMIVYAAGPLGGMKLYSRQSRTGTRSLALTEELSGNHRWPRWSPDGAQLVFIRNDADRSALEIVPAFGGSARTVYEAGAEQGEIFGASWSPDGKQLVFGMRGGVFLIPVDGGEPRRLVDLVDGHSPSWSPDGSRIAFVSGNPSFVFGTFVLGNIAPSALWVVSVPDTNAVRVTETTFLHMSPVWTPDGRSLVFISSHDGPRDIYQVEVDRSGKAVGERIRLTTGLNAHTLSISGDASLLAYSVLDTDANIWSVPIPKVGPVSASSATPVTEGNQTIEGIGVPLSGGWVAYDSDINGTQDIYRMSLGGGEPERLTTDPRDDFYPAWTSDGTQLAFYSFRTGKRDVWVMDADGANELQVTTDAGHNRAPQWSPDGQSLVYHSDKTGRAEVFIVSRDQATGVWGAPRQLTEDGGSNAIWSPDGDYIAFLNDEAVLVVSPDGGTPRALTEPPSDLETPAPWALAWSSDGSLVYYKAFDGRRQSSFWSVPVNGGAPRLLVEFDDPGFQSLRNEFSTDGSRFYFTVGFHESDIWEMDLGVQGRSTEDPGDDGSTLDRERSTPD